MYACRELSSYVYELQKELVIITMVTYKDMIVVPIV